MSPNLRAGTGCLMAVSAYAAAAPAMAVAFAATGRGCDYGRFLTDCDFAARIYDPRAYLALAVVTAACMAAVRLKAQARAWYPMAMLFGSIMLFTAGYDTVLRRPVIGVDKIVDDTFNTLRFAIMASFLLVFCISRRVRLPLAWSAVVVIASNAAAIAVAVLFREMSGFIMGTTKLYILFLLYAFGGFGLHIMATSWLFASSPMDEGMTVSTLGAPA